MEEKELIDILKAGARDLGIELNDGMVSSFLIYLMELKVWNKKINLTSIDSEKDIVIRHFLDSLTPYKLIKDLNIVKILDIGSGAGFPGVPLKIVDPGIEALLMDSVSKKVHFIRHIIRKLGLVNIDAISARAEDEKIIERYRGYFDCVISRALASLKEIVELSVPFLRANGVILAIKGPSIKDELKEIASSGGFIGLSGPELHGIKVPFTDMEDTIVLLRKIA